MSAIGTPDFVVETERELERKRPIVGGEAANALRVLRSVFSANLILARCALSQRRNCILFSSLSAAMSNANSPSTESLYDDSDELESLNAAEVAALLLPPRSLSTNSPSAVVPSTSDVSMGSADSVGVQTNVQQSTSNESTKQQNPASSEIIANDSATASSDLKTPSLVESLSTTSISASTELSNETDSATEFFKVPLPPPAAAQSLHGLPADIEHIIAMGANAPDESEPVPTSNYEKVVKNLREKAGFASSANAHSTAVLAGDGLASIEQEMLVGGVPRQEANIEMANGDADGAAWSSTRDVAMEEYVSSSTVRCDED